MHDNLSEATNTIESGVAAIAKNHVEAKPVRRTQASRRAETEMRLLRAALEIVARCGTQRMTLADVGVAAGYSRGIPAHHFGNKEGLLRSLAAFLEESYESRRLSAPRRMHGLDALRGAVYLYFSSNGDSSTETRAIQAMMSEALLEGSMVRDDIAAYNRRILAGIEHHIRAGIEIGEIRANIDPTAAATMLMGAMRGSMQQSFLHNGIDLIKVRDLILKTIDQVLAVEVQT